MIQAPDANRRRANFKRWMERRGLTPHGLAKATGVPVTTLYSYTQGKTYSLSGQTQEKIAAHYGSSVGEIFGHSKARWLGLSGSFRVDGALERYDAATQKAEAPPWLASADAVVACRVGELRISPATAQWLILFRDEKGKAPPLATLRDCWVLAELASGERVFSCVRPDDGGYVLERMGGGEPIKPAQAVRLLPLVAVTPSD